MVYKKDLVKNIDKGIVTSSVKIDGYTALMIGAVRGYDNIVQVLFEKGASINAKGNDGKTALLLAEQEGHAKVAQFLKEKGTR